MATKVKGEAIKEGSIPLNAICDSASLSSVFNVGTPFYLWILMTSII